MTFPEINYQFWLSKWNESIGQGKVYTNKNIEKYIKFENNINACTNEIIELTKYEEITKKNVFRVIDLIYSWGGRSGRMFYSKTKNRISPREELEKDSNVYETYFEGIILAKKGNTESISKFNSIRGIGASYASKHSYFWSINSDNPLIIVDSKIAGALGHISIDSLEKKSKYRETVQLFIDKAEIEFNDKNPSKVERALFAFHNFYFLNDNSGWKNRIEFEDFNQAKSLAELLFDKPKSK
ncbi:hypothetical protein ACFQZJ_13450 [Maribacter chungangensis]|uniref:Uncharacterized protein n=1 Tax=Maribacter chungangensis TaxID=1069117 RepID=A0ABW3B562_9FLAO